MSRNDEDWYDYDESGLRGVKLRGVELAGCSVCGTQVVTIPSMSKLHGALLGEFATGEFRLTGDRIRFMRKCLDTTEDEIAGALHVSRASWRAWEEGRELIPLAHEIGLRLLVTTQKLWDEDIYTMSTWASCEADEQRVIYYKYVSGDWERSVTKMEHDNAEEFKKKSGSASKSLRGLKVAGMTGEGVMRALFGGTREGSD